VTLINHTYRFIFVHVPKNAGTSVAMYLSQASTYRDQEIGGTQLGQAVAPFYRARFGLSKHSTVAEIGRAVGPETMAAYTSFAVWRDPTERLLSIYGFLRKWDAWRQLEGFVRFVPEFDACRDANDFIGSELFRTTSGPDRIFNPQAFWLADSSGRLGVANLLGLDGLSGQLGSLMERIGVPPAVLTTPLRIANRSDPGRPNLTTASIEAIARRYAADLLLQPAGR